MADPRMKELAYQALVSSFQSPNLGFESITDIEMAPSATPDVPSPVQEFTRAATPTIGPFEPTMRQRLGAGAQQGLEALGMRRPQARSVSQSIFGGPSSALPVNLGVADVVPFLGTAMQTEEAGMQLKRAGQLAEPGQMGQAALETGMGLLGLVPGGVGTTRAIKSVVKPPRKSAFDVEEDYFSRLDKDYNGLTQEYAALPKTKGGRLLNTDEARELSPDYRADRTRSADVHEPSSELVKRMYVDKLAQPTPEGRENIVLFTAGGTGAGKSRGLEVAEAVNKDVQNAEIIYDTNMSTFDTSDKKIQQALNAGRKVEILYTFRDPVDALEAGALSRATNMEKKSGSGRTVPISEHLKTHIGARKVMEQLQKKYKDDPRFSLNVIDNSRGKGKAVFSTLDKLPQLDDNRIKKGLEDALENAYKTGKISRAIYEGTRSNGN